MSRMSLTTNSRVSLVFGFIARVYIKNYLFKAEPLTITSHKQRTKRAEVIIIDKIREEAQTVYNSTNFTNTMSVHAVHIGKRTTTIRI